MKGVATVQLSVIMAAYNAERFVYPAIKSVLDQTHTDFELIVVDDGSTDRTPDILRSFADRDARVRVITQENHGAGAARNTAIESARAEWIAVMDADDVMEPHRLERQVAFVREHPDLAIASCLVTWINGDGLEMGRSESSLTTEFGVRAALKQHGLLVFCHPGCLIRRDVIRSIGGYRNEFWPSEDIDLFSRVADAGGRILVQPEHLLKYRVHPESGTGLTAAWDDTLHEWIRQCSVHRQRGLPEPELAELESLRRRVPWFRRLDRRRRDLANILYNKATFTYSSGRFATTVLLVSLSTSLDPWNITRKVWQRYARPRVKSSILADRRAHVRDSPSLGTVHDHHSSA